MKITIDIKKDYESYGDRILTYIYNGIIAGEFEFEEVEIPEQAAGIPPTEQTGATVATLRVDE